MTSHYLNQWWFVYQRINASLGFNELRVPFTNTISNHRDPHTPEKFQVSTFPHSWNVQHFHVCFDSNHLNCHNNNSPEKFNTLRLRQNGRHFPDNIFKCIFFSENVWISLKISLRFVPNGPINNIPALVQIMAWRRPGDKPLSEPMVVGLLSLGLNELRPLYDYSTILLTTKPGHQYMLWQIPGFTLGIWKMGVLGPECFWKMVVLSENLG